MKELSIGEVGVIGGKTVKCVREIYMCEGCLFFDDIYDRSICVIAHSLNEDIDVIFEEVKPC